MKIIIRAIRAIRGSQQPVDERGERPKPYDVRCEHSVDH
jgi:hypothetical protein